jgi:hypothetical protein
MARLPRRAGTLGLLAFSRNDVEGVIRNVETLRPILDEVVVIDSSFPAARASLSAALRHPRERIRVAPPLGNVDLLRPMGVAAMTSDRVLLLDSDESVSKPLLAALPDLSDADAYVLPRWESSLQGYTHHLRLFQRNAVTYSGRSYSFPHVRGVTRVLPRRFHIIHAAPGGNGYWDDGDRARRYLLSDFLERPYDWDYLRQTIGLSARLDATGGTSTRPMPTRSLSEPLVRLTLALEAARTLLTSQSLGLARFRLEQGRRRIKAWNAVSPEEKRWITETARQVKSAGGLVQFLGLDDAKYVERLSELLDSTLDGPDLLKFLLEIRSASGRVWQGDPSYPHS